MLNFTTLLIEQPSLSHRKYYRATNLHKYDLYRVRSWELLPSPAKEQRRTEARQQAIAEANWAEALNLPKNALDGLHLVFGLTEICKEKLLDPKVAKVLRHPDHQIRIAFSRTISRVGVKISSPVGNFSHQYPFSYSLLLTADEINQVRATRLLQKILSPTATNDTDKTDKETCPQRTVTVQPNTAQTASQIQNPKKEILLITLD